MDKQTTDLITVWFLLAILSIGLVKYFANDLPYWMYLIIAVIGPIILIIVFLIYAISQQQKNK